MRTNTLNSRPAMVVKPHRIFADRFGLPWEAISYPFVDGKVNVRVPGDPETIREFAVSALVRHVGACLCSELGDYWYRDTIGRDRVRHGEYGYAEHETKIEKE
jgi:hypothetical protein